MTKQLEISWFSLWRILFIVIFAVVLFILREVLTILFLALVISSALNAPVSFLTKYKIPRILGTLFIFIFIVGILALLLYTIVPVTIIEFKTLFSEFNKFEFLPQDFGFFKSSDLMKGLESQLGNFGDFADTLFAGSASFIDIISAFFGGIVFSVAVFVLSFYLTISENGVEKFLRAILPANQEDYVVDIYFRVRRKFGLWLQGQLILSLIIGIAIFLGLLILGVKYSLILGIMAGIMEMVPFVGPVFTGILAFLAAMSESWSLAISVIALFVIIQQMESHLLIPVVMRKTTGLHPVIVVISLLAGSQLAGFVGILLAVPTAVIIQEIIEDWAERKHQK